MVTTGGYRVDLTALTQAAQGITDTVNDVTGGNVTEIVGDQGALGHDHLASTLSDFCSRWQIGVQNLAKDGRTIAGRLTNSVVAYQKTEQAIHGQFAGILRSLTGPDPAAP